MPSHPARSAHQAAFHHYLRTGEQLTVAQWCARFERKFNPYHDELGRFTSPPGVTVSFGNHSARMTEAPAPAKQARSAPIKTIPPGGQVIAQGGLRAAKLANDAFARAREIVAPISPPAKALLTQIAVGEGTGDAASRHKGVASGYDVTFGYGIYASQSKPLTQMTLKEVDDLQTRILNHPKNVMNASPVGKYQIVRRTLREMRQKLNLTEDMLFDENLQDRLAMDRLEKRGLQEYLSGKITTRQFQINIADEWASVADPDTGKPRKQGQHLGTTSAQIDPLIRALRKTKVR